MRAISRMMKTGIALAFGLLVSAMLATAQSTGDLTKEMHHTYPFEKTGRVSVENINGDLRITGWDRPEVKLDVIISADTQAQLDEVTVDIDAYKTRIYIETRYPNRRGDDRSRGKRPARVDYTLMVPQSALIDGVKLINGSIYLKGVEGEISLSSVNGDIRAEGLINEGRISTVNGDMDLAWTRLNRTTPVDVHSVNGRIRLTIPSDANARISANTVHGSISNDLGLPVKRGRWVGNALAGRLGAGEGHIDLGNVNGSITVRLADDGRAKSSVENLDREDKGKRSWRDDDNDNDHDNDDDDDDGGGSWNSKNSVTPFAHRRGNSVVDPASDFSNIVDTVIRSVNGHQHVKVEHRIIMNQIKRDLHKSMQEAQREMARAMRELDRMRLDWDRTDWRRSRLNHKGHKE